MALLAGARGRAFGQRHVCSVAILAFKGRLFLVPVDARTRFALLDDDLVGRTGRPRPPRRYELARARPASPLQHAKSGRRGRADRRKEAVAQAVLKTLLF